MATAVSACPCLPAGARSPHPCCQGTIATVCRKGVGWLVASAAASGAAPPLVLPFVHSGMERVMPKGRALPKLGELEMRSVAGLSRTCCMERGESWSEASCPANAGGETCACG